ncbi:MAG: HNH endonuclease, partial [Bacteroidales bacterium]|nr:HNH endonuclease [Bacteroidales bacterium]
SGKLKRMGLLNGRDCRFKKGNIPPNKGKKRWWVGGEETQFKKGNIPTNYKPIGSERIGKKPKNSNLGYTEIKVADPNKWKMKHVIVWEAVNGPVPKGHCVIFADRDKSNFDIDNLLLVSRAELARMNQKGYIFENAELTKTGHIMAKLDCALGNKKNQK